MACDTTIIIDGDTSAVVSKQYTASVERRHSTDASLCMCPPFALRAVFAGY